MTRTFLALVSLLASQCASTPAFAQRQPGECVGFSSVQGGTSYNCNTAVDWSASDFSLLSDGAGTLTVGLSSSVSKFNTCVGDIASEFCATEDHTGRIGDYTAGTLKLPQGTNTPTTAGQVEQDTGTGSALKIGDGTRTRYFQPGIPGYVIGGTEASADFTYAGEVSSCSSQDTGGTRTVCRWGICTGSEGSGVCTLPFNSNFWRIILGNQSSAIFNFKSCAITAGTVTIGTPAAAGAPLFLRCRDFFTLTGASTKLDIKGKGSAGSSGGTPSCGSNTAGKASGSNNSHNAIDGGGGGSAGNNAGFAGNSTPWVDAAMLPYSFWSVLWHGSGGGAAPVSGNAAGNTSNNGQWPNVIVVGATGGGGGGCATSCSGTVGAGGAGGGFVRIETGGAYTFTGGTIDASGANGGSTAGGGGGGGIHVIARTIAANTGTYTVSGGTGGSSITNCGAGGAGGTGLAIVETYPR